VVKGVNGVSGFEFEILASDGRQIQKLKIKRVRPRGERSRPRGKGAPDGRDAPESGRAVDEDETGARAAE
jgi:hypothetical protein